jgi:hypothetical protein
MDKTEEKITNRHGWIVDPAILRYDMIVLSSQAMVHHAVRKTGAVVWPENHCSFHLITPFRDEIENPKVHVTYIDDIANIPQAMTRRVIVIEEDVFLPCGWDSNIKEYLEIDTSHIIVPGLTESPNKEQKSALMKRVISNVDLQMNWFNETSEPTVVPAHPRDILKPVYAFDRDAVEDFNSAKWGILKSCVLGNSTIKVREHTEEKFEEVEYNLLDLVY